jgi:hypothetical protein
MVDKVKPLKIEDPTKGTETDPFPKETDPTEDYLASKGVALECSDDTVIYGESGQMRFKDSDVTTEVTLLDLLDGGDGVSPGYSFGRSGNVSAGTYLQTVASVPSNKSNIPVNITSPAIVRVTAGSEDLNTYTLEIYEHEGDEINLTLLTSISSAASRSADSGTINISMTAGRRLAAKLSSGSAKNITAQVIIKGVNS